MAQVFIIEDDEIMAECVAHAITKIADIEISFFTNAVKAMQSLDENLPDLICLDILLSGPDGFSFLNELNSYTDTAEIPVIIITSLKLQTQDLTTYNVKKVLQKETMTPTEIVNTVTEVLSKHKVSNHA